MILSKKVPVIVLDPPMGVCRLGNTTTIPQWAMREMPYSITRTEDELSIVCPAKNIPAYAKSENGWRCLKLKGPLPFSMIGVLADISRLLFEQKISIFVISTYDTDYIMVKEEQLQKAFDALKAGGYKILD